MQPTPPNDTKNNNEIGIGPTLVQQTNAPIPMKPQRHLIYRVLGVWLGVFLSYVLLFLGMLFVVTAFSESDNSFYSPEGQNEFLFVLLLIAGMAIANFLVGGYLIKRYLTQGSNIAFAYLIFIYSIQYSITLFLREAPIYFQALSLLGFPVILYLLCIVREKKPKLASAKSIIILAIIFNVVFGFFYSFYYQHKALEQTPVYKDAKQYEELTFDSYLPTANNTEIKLAEIIEYRKEYEAPYNRMSFVLTSSEETILYEIEQFQTPDYHKPPESCAYKPPDFNDAFSAQEGLTSSIKTNTCEVYKKTDVCTIYKVYGMYLCETGNTVSILQLYRAPLRISNKLNVEKLQNPERILSSLEEIDQNQLNSLSQKQRVVN